MDVFKFREHIVDEYEQFTRSFTRIQAEDIRDYVNEQYVSQRYWPEPLIQINPNFKSGGTVEEFVAAGQLSAQCADIFRLGKSPSSAGVSLPLHKHQAEAISLAAAGESYVLTTGTGSGKSLSYFIPIIDACLKGKAADPTARTRAIVIYPMNALANSQLEELKKFLGSNPTERAVTFGRYTGQESEEERQAMAANPPDILLTNFMCWMNSTPTAAARVRMSRCSFAVCVRRLRKTLSASVPRPRWLPKARRWSETPSSRALLPECLARTSSTGTSLPNRCVVLRRKKKPLRLFHPASVRLYAPAYLRPPILFRWRHTLCPSGSN